MGFSTSERESSVDNTLATTNYRVRRNTKSSNKQLPPGALGKGAFGVVYKVHRDGRDYAAKMIENVSDISDMVMREIDLLRILEHPSIVNFIEAIQDTPNNWMFIIMDFVDGGDLQQALSSLPHAFLEPLARGMIFHCCCGMSYAHQRRVMHRDLKPENILLRKDFFPKIADFGISRLVHPQEFCQTIAGTPPYAAPEVLHFTTPYEFSADVFSFGRIWMDIFAPDRLLTWIPLGMLSPVDQKKNTKVWPPGTGPRPITKKLVDMGQTLLRDEPGQRPTFFALTRNLVQLEKEIPMPHPILNVPTKLADGPPEKKKLEAKSAHAIAARGGYQVGDDVLVNINGAWCPAKVTNISSSVCPGAVQLQVEATGQQMLVAPWQFDGILRKVVAEEKGFFRMCPKRCRSAGCSVM